MSDFLSKSGIRRKETKDKLNTQDIKLTTSICLVTILYH